MNKVFAALLCGALFFAATLAAAQTPIRARGTIESVAGDLMMVKTREGRELKIELGPNTRVSYMKLMSLADIKPGTAIGTTAVPDSSGRLVAREIHVFPPGPTVPGEGHRPWDLEPNSTMTNAAVSSVALVNRNREITLTYKGGQQTVIVPDNIPVVMPVSGDRTLLKPGEYVLLFAGMDNDGKVIATTIQVSKDGVRVPF